MWSGLLKFQTQSSHSNDWLFTSLEWSLRSSLCLWACWFQLSRFLPFYCCKVTLKLFRVFVVDLTSCWLRLVRLVCIRQLVFCQWIRLLSVLALTETSHAACDDSCLLLATPPDYAVVDVAWRRIVVIFWKWKHWKCTTLSTLTSCMFKVLSCLADVR